MDYSRYVKIYFFIKADKSTNKEVLRENLSAEVLNKLEGCDQFRGDLGDFAVMEEPMRTRSKSRGKSDRENLTEIRFESPLYRFEIARIPAEKELTSTYLVGSTYPWVGKVIKPLCREWQEKDANRR